ncbi:DUF3987 domain-containing protein [Burkholderia pseudomallei]|uniref:DUF3987 domain-containing protein n=1 Tax=Burkholderia pseudomallei TaxID=28450 RepID=UPI0009B5A005|nr:DUF3987 domain-containing protein [Burkholderia pseudomallei]MWA27783.1 DUF3987 domain-containing protein [Burkholderia pseudomallei]VCN33789.1 Uncharacterised protein [Burkholderia pseudomallei]VCN62320.1 Uncharacterised protein [Burkholderia pseudomallei]
MDSEKNDVEIIHARPPLCYALPPEPLTRLPVLALPHSIRSAVEEVAYVDQAPLELIVTAAMASIAIACQNFVNVVRPNRPPSACSLFFLIGLATGEGKSVVEERFFPPFLSFYAEQQAAADAAMPAYKSRMERYEIEKQELRRELRQAIRRKENHADLDQRLDELEQSIQKHESARPMAQQLLYTNVQGAGLREGFLRAGRSAGIVSFDAGDILNGPLTNEMGTLNDLWDGKDLRVDLAAGPRSVHSPRLSVLFAAQPALINKFESRKGDEGKASGFLGRFLYQEPPPVGLIEPGRTSPFEALQAFNARLGQIIRQPVPKSNDLRTRLEFDGGAAEYWKSYFRALREAEEASNSDWLLEIKGFMRKLPEQAARIAALFHYFEGYSGAISESTIASAIGLCDWYMSSYYNRFCLAGRSRSQHVEKIADDLMRQLKKHFDAQDRSGTIFSSKVEPPSVDKNGRVRGVNSGRKFWAAETWWIAYTQSEIHNRLLECDYDLLGRAIDILAERGLVKVERGPKNGRVVFFSPHITSQRATFGMPYSSRYEPTI